MMTVPLMKKIQVMKRTWKWHFYFVRKHLLDISPNKNRQNQVASVLWETFNNWKYGRNTTVQEINECRSPSTEPSLFYA